MSESPIDFVQLDMVSGYEEEGRRYLIDVYLQETQRDVDRLSAAIAKRDAAEIHRLAHGCAGASLSYGMMNVITPLRMMEREARDGDLSKAPEHFDAFRHAFAILTDYLSNNPLPPIKSQAA